MQRRSIALVLALEEIGKSLSLLTFDDRLILQKLVHLIQKVGVHLGYRYGWYLHGPYSPGLAEDAFEMWGEMTQSSKPWVGWSLDKASKQRLQGLRSALCSLPNSHLEESKRLEIVASTLWAVDCGWAAPSDPIELHRALRQRGKEHFQPKQVEEAVRWLKTNDLVKAT